MRFISHDYSDAELVNILSHISEAMSCDSKLLLVDTVIPERLDESTMVAGVLDQIMFAIGGKERTKQDFEAVLGQVDLSLNEVYHIPGSPGAVVEAVKVKT